HDRERLRPYQPRAELRDAERHAARDDACQRARPDGRGRVTVHTTDATPPAQKARARATAARSRKSSREGYTSPRRPRTERCGLALQHLADASDRKGARRLQQLADDGGEG